MSGDFFADTFGFEEAEYGPTRDKLLANAEFTNTANTFYSEESCVLNNGAKKVHAGRFSTPSVDELRKEVEEMLANKELAEKLEEYRKQIGSSQVIVRDQVGESRSLHSEVDSQNATVQAASQFNCLEFASPGVVPERGITCYLWDRTQGPACAIACAAGTAYRNYLATTTPDERFDAAASAELRGQRKDRQINCLKDIEEVVRAQLPEGGKLWTVKNGYVEATAPILNAVNPLLDASLKNKLRIGVQADTQVTDQGAGMTRTRNAEGKWVFEGSDEPWIVTQTYNSALSIGYSSLSDTLWERLATIVLNGTYEATFLVAVKQVLLSLQRGQKPGPLLLTKVGGGVFQNRSEWICSAISDAVAAVSGFQVPLDVRLVHYGSVEGGYESVITPSSQ